MSDMRLETLADSVLDAWESGAQVDFSSAGDDAALRLELADLERAATVVAAASAARTASIEPMRPEFLAKLAQLGTSITFPAPAAALPSSAAPVLGRAIARRRVAPLRRRAGPRPLLRDTRCWPASYRNGCCWAPHHRD